MGVEHPGMVIFAGLFAMLGLYLLAKGPAVWRTMAFLPLFPLLMCLLWLDVALTEGREGVDLGLLVTLAIGVVIVPGIFMARQYFGPNESWAVHNVNRTQLTAALERALRSHAIPFDWHINRLRLPTIGTGGSAMMINRWFGSTGIEIVAPDRDERRIVSQTILPLFREELSRLPRPIVPWSGVFCLVYAALLLVVGLLPRVFG
jgi:hypothetical protein